MRYYNKQKKKKNKSFVLLFNDRYLEQESYEQLKYVKFMINQFQLHCCVVNKLCDENECLFKLRGLIIYSNSQLVAQLVLTLTL